MTDPKFHVLQIPINCLAGISEVFNGQYDHVSIDLMLKKDAIYCPFIVDIGANIGAFSIWCKTRFRSSSVICYEPDSRLIPHLKRNCEPFGIIVKNSAVTPIKNPSLFHGDTPLCNSVYKWNRSSGESEQCEGIHPDCLPACDILKIDAEGSEADILENIKFIPLYLIIEWHSYNLLMRCLEAMRGKMRIVSLTHEDSNHGMLKMVRINETSFPASGESFQQEKAPTLAEANSVRSADGD